MAENIVPISDKFPLASKASHSYRVDVKTYPYKEETLKYDRALKGIGELYERPFLVTLRKGMLKFPEAKIEDALSRNQMASKRWLMDQLFMVTEGKIGNLYVLGSWYGLLPAIMHDDGRFQISHAALFDIDAHCEEIAAYLTRDLEKTGIPVDTVTADMYKIDYAGKNFARPDLVVNTCCEHIEDINSWLKLIPKGTMLLLQSNNMFGGEGHINCVNNLEEFCAQIGLTETLFAGTLVRPTYDRYMVIGRR